MPKGMGVFCAVRCAQRVAWERAVTKNVCVFLCVCK